MAIDFLQAVVEGRIDVAFRRFVDTEGIHHNPHFNAGFDELKKAMKHHHSLYPDKDFEIKQILAEGDRVALHSKMQFDGKVFAIVYFFRFRSDKIFEMWDIVQNMPSNLPNTDGAF